jgi:hypothetical protein
MLNRPRLVDSALYCALERQVLCIFKFHVWSFRWPCFQTVKVAFYFCRVLHVSAVRRLY